MLPNGCKSNHVAIRVTESITRFFEGELYLHVNKGRTVRFGERYEQTVMISNPEVQTQIVAHRGYWDTKGSAQNSIASLRKAADAKVYGSECDVHITADSVIIVNHDPKINDLVIADSKYADLKIQLLKNGEEVSTL